VLPPLPWDITRDRFLLLLIIMILLLHKDSPPRLSFILIGPYFSWSFKHDSSLKEAIAEVHHFEFALPKHNFFKYCLNFDILFELYTINIRTSLCNKKIPRGFPAQRKKCIMIFQFSEFLIFCLVMYFINNHVTIIL